ncbi:MAG: PaaI family thioesterase [Ectothiorhodospiraceae bacterium]|nr:PaaI family thioesterase [Ectothiorhodospiraceae bacterium]
MTQAAPAGYQRHTRRSPLTDPWEPLYARKTPGSVALAVEIREPHCNSRGFAHGGLITALSDTAMGLSAVVTAREAGRETAGALTISLSLDFVGSAEPGDWLEILPTVLKAGGTLAFTECRVICGERLVARGNATFRMRQGNTD